MRSYEDIRVLDMTQSVAGPVCTQLLGSMGADVVKVEPPSGEIFREQLQGAFFSAYNLGDKKSLSINLKDDDAQQVVKELATDADVIVENYRPSTLEKFDLDYESVSEYNDDVVYCSISGFGQSGPYSDYSAFDPVVQAMSGLMSATGPANGTPVRIGASLVDCGTGMMAAFLVASGLVDRYRTGKGEYIDVSLLDVATSWMGYWIAHYSGTGETPERTGSEFPGIAPYDIYYAGDGEPLFLGAVSDKLFERVCNVVDRKDLVDDDRFETSEDRWEHKEILREELENAFEEYDRDELVELLADAGVPVGPLMDVDELVEDPHVESREMVVETYNHYLDKDVDTANLPFRTERGGESLGDRPPKVGEHSRDVLADLGFSEAEIEELVADGVVFEEN